LKIAIYSLNFALGKKNLADERLKELSQILHPQNVVSIQVELVGFDSSRELDALIVKRELKEDLLLMDLEKIEEGILKDSQRKDFFMLLKEKLEKEVLLNEISFSSEESKIIQALNLITAKPIIFMEEQEVDLLPHKIKELYYKSKRICFFTANEKQLRAWEIKEGANAYEASGLIHSDIQKGFIRAEVINYNTIKQEGSLSAAKAKGLVRLEGKNYAIQDGDLIYFRFNV